MRVIMDLKLNREQLQFLSNIPFKKNCHNPPFEIEYILYGNKGYIKRNRIIVALCTLGIITNNGVNWNTKKLSYRLSTFGKKVVNHILTTPMFIGSPYQIITTVPSYHYAYPYNGNIYTLVHVFEAKKEYSKSEIEKYYGSTYALFRKLRNEGRLGYTPYKIFLRKVCNRSMDRYIFSDGETYIPIAVNPGIEFLLQTK